MGGRSVCCPPSRAPRWGRADWGGILAYGLQTPIAPTWVEQLRGRPGTHLRAAPGVSVPSVPARGGLRARRGGPEGPQNSTWSRVSVSPKLIHRRLLRVLPPHGRGADVGCARLELHAGASAVPGRLVPARAVTSGAAPSRPRWILLARTDLYGQTWKAGLRSPCFTRPLPGSPGATASASAPSVACGRELALGSFLLTLSQRCLKNCRREVSLHLLLSGQKGREVTTEPESELLTGGCTAGPLSGWPAGPHAGAQGPSVCVPLVPGWRG